MSLLAAHTKVTLLLDAATAKPGSTVLVGVQLEMEPGWHTYWKNPGESGDATKMTWSLPPGITAGEIQWPLPKKIPPADVTTYGYEDKTILIAPLTLASNLPVGPQTISAKLTWLECKEACLPGKDEVSTTLEIGDRLTKSEHAELIAEWQAKVPQRFPGYQFEAKWEAETTNNTRTVMLSNLTGDATKNVKYDNVDFFPEASDDYAFEPKVEIISAFSADLKLRLRVQKYSGDWPKELAGVLILQNGESRTGVVVKTPLVDSAKSAAVISNSSPPQSLWNMLLYAFLGGLILNAMPCVLPVIALKILGFVNEAKSSPRRIRALGGIYTIGVLFSFLVFAAAIIGVKAAGMQAGWGMQFTSPIFIVCLTALVTLVALNLFGVFEVTLGSGTMDSAGNLAAKSGAAGAFFNGVLATILATPCTAPFLGAALGFAFLQPPSIIVLIFLTVGLGLASPYLILSWHPAWLKFLPKPGAWMEKFKIAMGFPMLATVLWLFDIASGVYGSDVFWLGIFLVFVAAAAWVFGDFFQRGRSGKFTALVITLILLATGYSFALEKKLSWRSPAAKPEGAAVAPELSEGIAWQAWSPQAVADAQAAGRPVLVDFTARWCVTCNAVVKPAIADSSVAAQLKSLNAVALLADYTSQPPEMSKEISSHGVAGVPLVLVYPKTGGPIVLPQPSPFQLPAQYRKVILEALAQAAK